MYSGKLVFAQVMDHLPMHTFRRAVSRYGLNRVLEEAGFDAFVEGLCAVFYAARMGRPSLRPGRHFRMLFIGYFEGLSSERGIAWRVADSLSLRSFLDLDVTEASPDHSTLSRTRRPRVLVLGIGFLVALMVGSCLERLEPRDRGQEHSAPARAGRRISTPA